jgi:hypothetical protein
MLHYLAFIGDIPERSSFLNATSGKLSMRCEGPLTRGSDAAAHVEKVRREHCWCARIPSSRGVLRMFACHAFVLV